MTRKPRAPSKASGPLPVRVVQFGDDAAPLVAPLLAAADAPVPVVVEPIGGGPADPAVLAHLERVRLLFASLRGKGPAFVVAGMERIGVAWQASVRYDLGRDRDLEVTRDVTPAMAADGLGRLVAAAAERRHAELGAAIAAYKTPAAGPAEKRPRKRGGT